MSYKLQVVIPSTILTLTDLKSVSDSYSRFQIRIRSFVFKYEAGKFKSDSLVFQRKLITLKVKISVLTLCGMGFFEPSAGGGGGSGPPVRTLLLLLRWS